MTTQTKTIHPNLLQKHLDNLYEDIEMTKDNIKYTPELITDPLEFTIRYLEEITKTLDTIYHNAL